MGEKATSAGGAHPLVLIALAGVAMHCSDPKDADPSSADASVASSDAGAISGWATIRSVGAGPIQETGVAALGGKVYVVGGFNDELQVQSLVQVYDPGSDQWSTAAPLPRAVHHANVAATGGKLYVLGAMVLDGFGFQAIGDSYSYDPTTDTWQDLTPMPAGSERGSAVMGVIGGKIYLAGGLGDGALGDFSSYDPETASWDTELPALPELRDHAMGASVGDTLYAIGGRSGDIDSVQSSVYAFSVSDPVWRERAPMPTARGGGAAGVVNGQVLVVGGEGNSDIASGVFPQTESYDPVADTWTALPDMPAPRHGMGAAGIGGTLYVPGGATKQAFGAVDVAEAFTP